MKLRDKILTICKPLAYEKYKNIPLNSLVVYVIDFLGKNQIPLSFENICVAAYQMFPKKFSLQDYDEFPDAARINRVLLHLRPKYENLAEGNVKSGFILTPKGKLIIQTVESLLEQKIQGEPEETRPKPEGKRINEIRSSIAFQKFIQNKFDDIQMDEIYGFLQATSYTSKKSIRNFLAETQTIAKDRDDGDVFNFIKAVKTKFGYLFKGD